MLARLLFKYILIRAVAFTYTHRCKISHVTSCQFALPVTLPIQALPIAIADCHFDSGFDHVASHVASKFLLACAPLAMWEFPTSRLSVSSATAVIFQVNTNSRLLCNSTYIGFTKIRCQQNSNGKVRQDFGLMLHNILMLMQFWSSLAWVSILVWLNFSFNKF